MFGSRVIKPGPLVGFTRVIQAQVVVDGLGGQHGGQAFRQRLEAVQGAIAPHADEPFDPQLAQAGLNQVNLRALVRVEVIP